MQLRLNENKTVEVKFGVGFVRELDKNHPLESRGMKLGMALSMKIPEMMLMKISKLYLMKLLKSLKKVMRERD